MCSSDLSEFDWHITPYHSSSDTLAAVTGTDLLTDFSVTHPDHGRLTRFRVVQQLHFVALFRLAFTMAPSNDLTLLIKLTRWIVLQKARRHRINLLRLLVGTKFQVLFHSPPGVLFTFPSRYSFTIDHVIYLALEGGPPGFSQGFSCPDLLKKTHIKSA